MKWAVVIDNEYGSHNIWIDPEHGYAPRKILVTKSSTDKWDKWFLKDSPRQGIEPDSAIVNSELVMDSVKIAKIGDNYAISDANITSKRIYQNGKSFISTAVLHKTGINFNPNYDELKAFVVDVPNGTTVTFFDERHNAGIHFTWQDGKVVTDVDKRFLDLINNNVSDAANEMIPRPVTNLKADYEHNVGTIQTSTMVPSEKNKISNEPVSRSYYMIGIVFFLVVVTIVILLRYLRLSKKLQ